MNSNCRRRVLILSGLIACLAIHFTAAQDAKKAVPPAPKVLVTRVVERIVSEGRSFVGTVMPLRKSIVGSAAPGRVEEYLVDEGNRVRKGQPIARLRTGIIQAELDSAKASLKVAQAELAELENGSRPEEVDQAKAKLAMAEANRALRMANRDRTLKLGTAVSQEDVEQYVALASVAEGEYVNAKATLTLLELGPRQEKIAQAHARVEVGSAEVQRLSEQLERHTMFAPFDGFVTKEHTEVGQWLMQGDPVAEILELNEVDIEIPVLEDYVAKLTIGTEARVEIGALAEMSQAPRVFTGKLAIINPQADIRARTFPIKIRVANTISENIALIKAGMFARVTLPVGKPIKATMVPKDAVVFGGPAPVVFVVAPMGEKQMVKQVPVTLGITDKSLVQVLGELWPGDLVVVEGNERLRPGQEIRHEEVSREAAQLEEAPRDQAPRSSK